MKKGTEWKLVEISLILYKRLYIFTNTFSFIFPLKFRSVWDESIHFVNHLAKFLSDSRLDSNEFECLTSRFPEIVESV